MSALHHSSAMEKDCLLPSASPFPGETPASKHTQRIRVLALSYLSLATFYLYFWSAIGERVSRIHNHYFLSHRDHALKILKHHPLIDGHNDLAIAVRAKYGNHIYSKDFTGPFENGNFTGNLDLPRMHEGRYSAFMSAFWLCPADPYDFSAEAYAPIVKATYQQIDLLHRLSNQYPKYFPQTLTVGDVKRNFRHGGHVAPLIIEGLHQIGNSYADLRTMYDLGVRYATLNWNCHNIYTDAALLTYLTNGTTIPAPTLHGGVSLTGRHLIHEMNRLGMIVDLAHVSTNTMRDVLIGEHNADYPLNDTTHRWTGSIAPPIFSHSSAHAICPHPRNVPDEILPLVKQRNSIVMINFNPDFVSCHYEKGSDPATSLPTTDASGATLEKVVDHITHIGKMIGYSHVGIGSDFDGIESTPTGLEGVDKMPELVAELLRRGVSEEDVVKVIGGNVLRVWAEVEKVAAKMQKEGVRPAEDDLPNLRGPGL